MNKRRLGRETALQYLYQLDMQSHPAEELSDGFWALVEASAPVRKFAEALVRAVVLHRTEIDRTISRLCVNYTLSRLAAVDRNILRIAICEMLHSADVPPVVAINEAIDIAKKFGSDESGKFVNGVLDRLRKEINRPARTAAESVSTDVPMADAAAAELTQQQTDSTIGG
jgi:N utilization substance protein B